MSTQYDILTIQHYLEGRLSPQQMHELERAATADPMLQDAIDGYSLTNSVSHKQLSLLQQRLSARIESQQAERNTFYFTGQRLAIASIAGVMLIVLCTLIWMMNVRQGQKDLSALSTDTILLSKSDVTLLSGSLEPLDSWPAYEDYLSVNGTLIPPGLTVHLKIDIRDGRPAVIEVLSPHEERIVLEVKRLIAEGPAWKEGAGEITITF